MEIIALNVWGAHVYDPLMKFIEVHHQVEIFCFQEVYHRALHKISTDDRWVALNGLDDIAQSLNEHAVYFQPIVGEGYGMASLIHRSIKVLASGFEWIHHNPNYTGSGPAHPRLLQWFQLQKDGKTFVVINLHGLWNGQGKTDTPERLLQSDQVVKFLKTLKDPFILCGDFNLRPDSESFLRIAQSVPGLKDWITLSQTSSTRSIFYPKTERFADYLLTSPSIQVEGFLVLNEVEDQVSDHLPLWAKFEVNS